MNLSTGKWLSTTMKSKNLNQLGQFACWLPSHYLYYAKSLHEPILICWNPLPHVNILATFCSNLRSCQSRNLIWIFMTKCHKFVLAAMSNHLHTLTSSVFMGFSWRRKMTAEYVSFCCWLAAKILWHLFGSCQEAIFSPGSALGFVDQKHCTDFLSNIPAWQSMPWGYVTQKQPQFHSNLFKF